MWMLAISYKFTSSYLDLKFTLLQLIWKDTRELTPVLYLSKPVIIGYLLPEIIIILVLKFYLLTNLKKKNTGCARKYFASS